MVAFPAFPNLKRPTLPTSGGLAAAVVAALAIVALPGGALERLVWSSGIAALIPAAQPPLGATARLLIGAGAGVIAGAVAWAALFLLFGPEGFLARASAEHDAPIVRRADAHPDAPPRRPMTAADLGTPFMEVPARPPPVQPPPVQPLPADLDQPLAAFDPAAIPATPREPSRVLAPLAPGERIETFVLAPPPPSVAPIRRKPAPPPSIDALLRRLEEGAARRANAA